METTVEVEKDLKKDFKKKLRVNDRLTPEPFKTPHGWLEKDEGMEFWAMLLYPDSYILIICLMFCPK